MRRREHARKNMREREDDVDSSNWDARYAEASPLWSGGPDQPVIEAVRGRRPGRALDLASGEGRNALWLAERGWQVTAVDFSAVALSKAAEKASSSGPELSARLEWVHADLLTYRPDTAQYDLVLLVFLQAPERERKHVLRSAASALAPGGTLLVIAHHTDNLEHGVGGPQDPAVLYTQQDVVADLSECSGLETERAETVRREVAGASQPALDLLVITRRVTVPK